MAWTYASSGWGPVERDQSNGELNAGDGRPITLNGVAYPKGLGVHAQSDVRFNLEGQYASFQAEVGVDDEVGSNGSVTFQVWADNELLFDSGLMTGDTATRIVDVNVTGKQELRLIVVSDSNMDYDHADWANARLVPAIPPPNRLPVANAGGPYSAWATKAVRLDGTASYDPDGSIVSYKWQFGDGTKGSGPTPAHAYAAPGVYTVILTVTDNSGATGTSATTVTVMGPPAAPADLTAASSYVARVTLRWNDTSDNEQSFKIERAPANTGAFTVIATVAANTVTYTDKGVKSGATYMYRVRAINNAGPSAYSNTASVKVK
jgi:PKD repeat protein